MRNIISNRKFLFTNNFWFTLCWNLKTKRKFSIVFHSQTNKQTKKQNVVFEHYLRMYCNFKQNKWSKLLFMTQFVYNNNKHSNIDQTFQKFLFEYVANLNNNFVNNLSKKTFATNKTKTLQSNRTHLMNLWKAIFEQQIKYYNENHIMKNFKFEKKMLLRDINIRTLSFKKKIDYKQLNFFEIVKKINTQIYELNLFEQYKFIHFVFYVFLFEFWYNRDDANSKSQTILMKNEKKWKISQMLNKRVRKNQF